MELSSPKEQIYKFFYQLQKLIYFIYSSFKLNQSKKMELSSPKEPTENQFLEILGKLRNEDTLNRFIIRITEIEKIFTYYREKGLFIPVYFGFSHTINQYIDSNETNTLNKNNFKILNSKQINTPSKILINIIDTELRKHNNKVGDILRKQVNFINSIIEVEFDVLEFFGFICFNPKPSNSSSQYNRRYVSLQSTLPPLNISDYFPNLKSINIDDKYNNVFFSSSLLESLKIDISYDIELDLSNILKYCPNIKNISINEAFFLESILRVLATEKRVFDHLSMFVSFNHDIPQNGYLKTKTLEIVNHHLNIDILRVARHFFRIEHLCGNFHVLCNTNEEFIECLDILQSLNCTFHGPTIRLGTLKQSDLNIQNQNLCNFPKEWVSKNIKWLYTHRNLFDHVFQKDIENKYIKFTFCSGLINSNKNQSSIGRFGDSEIFDFHVLPLVFNYL